MIMENLGEIIMAAGFLLVLSAVILSCGEPGEEDAPDLTGR
mgnify:CR=1 FL=1